MSRCSKCKRVWYCDRNCQREDWCEHKLECTGTYKMDHKAVAIEAAISIKLEDARAAIISDTNPNPDPERDLGHTRCHLANKGHPSTWSTEVGRV